MGPAVNEQQFETDFRFIELGKKQARLLLGVGLLGGFTTFSAFSLELTLLMERGQWTLAFIYLALSVALGVTGLIFGLTVTRLIG